MYALQKKKHHQGTIYLKKKKKKKKKGITLKLISVTQMESLRHPVV